MVGQNKHIIYQCFFYNLYHKIELKILDIYHFISLQKLSSTNQHLPPPLVDIRHTWPILSILKM